MKNITDTIETTEHCDIIVPQNPWEFAGLIQASQKRPLDIYSITVYILFNKGRYFEVTVPTPVIKKLEELTGLECKFETMFCASWTKLEDFVIALNCLGIYAKIKCDWI